MRDAPSVQSEFHRVGRLDPPTSGSRVPDNKTQPSSSPGPLPVTGRLPDQFHRIGRPRHPASGSGVPDIKTHPPSSFGHFASSWPFVRTVDSGRLYGHLCQSPLLCLQYSYRAASQRVAVLSYTASGPSVPGFRIRRPSEDLVSQSAVQSVSSCQSESVEQSVVGQQHGPGPFGLQSPSDSVGRGIRRRVQGCPISKPIPLLRLAILPAAGPLSKQLVQDVCMDTCVKVPCSVCSTVIGQPPRALQCLVTPRRDPVSPVSEFVAPLKTLRVSQQCSR